MRKQGCKTNVARIDRAGALSGLELQEVTSAQAQPVASTATTSHLTQLVTR
jgi:hypothetical protein